MKKLILTDSVENVSRNTVIVALNLETKNKINGAKFINDFMEKDSHLKAMHWLKNWSENEIINGKNFKELLEYEGTSLWWFSDFWLYYHPMHKDALYDIAIYLDAIKNVINKEKPTKIILNTKNETIKNITKLLAKKNSINLKLKKGIPHFQLPIEYLKKKKFFLRKIFSKIIISKKIRNEKKDYLFFSYPTNLERVGNSYKDRFLGAISENLENKKYIDIDYEPTSGISGIIKRKKEYVPFESFCVNKKIKKYEKLWKVLNKNNNFKKSFDFEGTNIYPLLKDKIKFILTKRSSEAIKYIETANKLLKTVQPKKTIITDETGFYGRSIIVASKLNKIPSVGIMHGLSNPTAFEYVHNKGENCPIPDKTLVFGQYTKNFLIEHGNYPKDKIEIVGQSRYDFLFDKNEFPKKSKKSIFEKIGLDKNKKLVVYFSEGLSETEEGGLSHSIFGAMKELDINFVVKLHPKEYGNKKTFYENLAKNIGIKVKVIKDINIFELINILDLGIVMHSNTGMEISMLKKPLLVVNVTGKEDVFPYVKEGIALGAYNQKEIAPKIKELLENQTTKNKLQKARDRFINYRLFKLDGKAHERAINFIKK